MNLMKRSLMFSSLAVAIAFSSMNARAYPLLSSAASSSSNNAIFYVDHENAAKYWYIPLVIDPVANLDGSVSAPVISAGRYLYFAYSGQPQIPRSDLEEFASDHHIQVSDIAPVPYETTQNAYCFNLDASKITIQIPHSVGSFMEHVPVSVYTTDPLSIEILTSSFANGSGINCYVDATIKAAVDAYSVDYSVDMNDLFTKFQANLHGSAFIFEVDINAALKSYTRDGSIKVRTFTDNSVDSTPISIDDPNQKIQDMFMGVFALVKEQLFVRQTSIPDVALAGRGQPFSLRTDYQRSSEHFGFNGHLEQQGTTLHATTIKIRVAPLRQ